MITAFQSNAFQNNAFQIDTGAVVATATAASLPGHWRGPAGGKRRRPMLGRTRLLSELDPPKTEEQLFTVEEVLEAPPAQKLDEATLAKIEVAAMSAFDGMVSEAELRKKLIERELQLRDDDDTFMMVM